MKFHYKDFPFPQDLVKIPIITCIYCGQEHDESDFPPLDWTSCNDGSCKRCNRNFRWCKKYSSLDKPPYYICLKPLDSGYPSMEPCYPDVENFNTKEVVEIIEKFQKEDNPYKVKNGRYYG